MFHKKGTFASQIFLGGHVPPRAPPRFLRPCSKWFKQNGRLLNAETGLHVLAILNYATVCLHPSVSLNNDKICREFSEHKIAVCEKTAGLRSGNSSDLNSACLKVLVPVEIFQFSDMHYETERYRDPTDGLNTEKFSFYSKRIFVPCYVQCLPFFVLKIPLMAKVCCETRYQKSTLNYGCC